MSLQFKIMRIGFAMAMLFSSPLLKSQPLLKPISVLAEYPRPQLKRSNWINLNGTWEYGIADSTANTVSYEGKIVVPYPLESSLSGVKKKLLPGQLLWYRRNFTTPEAHKHQRLLLHFGAVDYLAKVFVNGKSAGEHQGGYDAFTLDITQAIKSKTTELTVSVWDPSDKGSNACGKQTLNPRTSFFTASSGIWQTVWLEVVPDVYITDLKLTPDVDNHCLKIQVNINSANEGYSTETIIHTKGKVISDKLFKAAHMPFNMPVPQAHLWSPDDPFLYDLTIYLKHNGKIVDTVASYFGMRKVEIKKDEQGFERIFLNNKYTYNLGVLDQGFWPDGVYTAPTDSALILDIATIKAMGFNTIRKHVKVEPERWYYHCDRLGVLVWQDMPCRAPGIKKIDDTQASRVAFERELKTMIDQKYNHPSIITWIPFNEDWAVYDADRIEKLIRRQDPTRLINTNTGSRLTKGPSGDFSVTHHYCYPVMPVYYPGKPRVLGEFGGVNVIIPNHEWQPGFSWGHGEIQNNGIDFQYLYEDWMYRIKRLEKEGLTASIFTQPYDCEHEECGLMTYDRKVMKIPVDTLKKINAPIFKN